MRAIVATVAGAIVCFIWGMTVWMVPLVHKDSLRTLPNESALTELLKSQKLEHATYASPMPAAEGGDASKRMEDFMSRHKQGPVYMLNYDPNGSVPMGPRVLGVGMAINFVGSAILAILISMAAQLGWSYAGRAGIGLLLGLFEAVTAHGSMWNWMNIAPNWSIPMMIDVTIAWTLVGLVQAAILRPKPQRVLIAEKT